MYNDDNDYLQTRNRQQYFSLLISTINTIINTLIVRQLEKNAIKVNARKTLSMFSYLLLGVLGSTVGDVRAVYEQPLPYYYYRGNIELHIIIMYDNSHVDDIR